MAFNATIGYSEYLVMLPFLTIAPLVFQALVNDILCNTRKQLQRFLDFANIYHYFIID